MDFLQGAKYCKDLDNNSQLAKAIKMSAAGMRLGVDSWRAAAVEVKEIPDKTCAPLYKLVSRLFPESSKMPAPRPAWADGLKTRLDTQHAEQAGPAAAMSQALKSQAEPAAAMPNVKVVEKAAADVAPAAAAVVAPATPKAAATKQKHQLRLLLQKLLLRGQVFCPRLCGLTTS